MVKFALLVRIEAKPGKETTVAQFLESSLQRANQGGTTPGWFALRLGPSTFGIFDAFRDDAGRKVHLAGSTVASLMANAASLLAKAPQIEQIDLLAPKLAEWREVGTPPAQDHPLGLGLAAVTPDAILSDFDTNCGDRRDGGIVE